MNQDKKPKSTIVVEAYPGGPALFTEMRLYKISSNTDASYCDALVLASSEKEAWDLFIKADAEGLYCEDLGYEVKLGFYDIEVVDLIKPSVVISTVPV
jgi:hypothetical protein